MTAVSAEMKSELGLPEANWYYIENNRIDTAFWLKFSNNGSEETKDSGEYTLTKDLYLQAIPGEGVQTGVGEIEVDENAPVGYFNFQGVRVENPEKGMYIRVQGGKTIKVIVK